MLTWLNRRPIGQQILFLILIILGPTSMLFVVYLTEDLQSETEEAHAKIRQLAQRTSTAIERDIQQNQLFLAQMALLPEVQALDPSACVPALNAMGNLKPEFQHFAVVNLRGQLVCSYRPQPPSQKLIAIQMALRKAHPSHQLIHSAAIYDEASATWLALLSYPIFKDGAKQASGVVILALDLVKLNQEIFNEAAGDALIAVLDQHHVIVLRSKEVERFIGKLANPVLRERLNDNAGKVTTAPSISGELYMVTTQAIPLNQWTVIAGFPQKMLLAERERVVHMSIFFGIPGLLLIIVMAWRVGRNIIAPISTLGETASKIANGDRHIRAVPIGPREIVAVAEQFNRILDLRDQNETSLSEAASFSRSILNSITSEIAVLNHDGLILMLNDAWCKFTKENSPNPCAYDSHAQIGTNYLQASEGRYSDNSPESRLAQEVNQGIRAVLNGEATSYSTEYPCHAPHQHRWFHLSVTPFGHTQNGVVISHTDISERKLADMALLQNQALLGSIINSTPSTVFALDLEQRFTMLNDATAKFFELPKSAILGKHLSEVFPAEMAAQLQQTNEAILKSGKVYFNEEIVTVKNGKPNRVMITSKFPLRDIHGNITGIAGVATDVTEFQAAREALREREAQNQALINAIPDIIFVNRRDGEYITCRTSANHSLLLPPEALLHKKVYEILPPEIASLCMQGITTAIECKSTQEVTYVLNLHGEERYFEARITPFGEDTALSIVRDVSEHKRAEFALLASLQEKLSLLNEVHHRVKNNLQIISSLLRLEAGRSSTSETKVILTDMQSRIRSMALLHEFLYRNGAHTSVDLSEYLKQLATQVFSAHLVQPHLIALQFDVTTVRVSMDQATPCGLLINELLTNCLSHAFPKGESGIVKLSLTKTNTANAANAANEVCLCVTDDGIGLSEEIVNLPKKSLGLQLVQDLTRQLKGKLQFSNQENTSFSIIFTTDVPSGGEFGNTPPR